MRDEPLPGGTALDVQVQVPSALIDAPEPAWQSNPTTLSSRNEGVTPYVPSETSDTGVDWGFIGTIIFWGSILVGVIILGRVFGNGSSSSSHHYDNSRSSFWNDSDRHSHNSWDDDHRSWGGGSSWSGNDGGSSWGSDSSSDSGSGGGGGGAD